MEEFFENEFAGEVPEESCNWEPCVQQTVNLGNLGRQVKTPQTPYSAIIFTDLKASSKLWGQAPNKNWNKKVLSWVQMHFNLIHELIQIFNQDEANDGFIVKTVGDAAMIYCPWDLKKVILFCLCLQCHMRDLNDSIYRHSTGKTKASLDQVYKRIPKPKLIHQQGEPPVFFSMRIGFCYGKFRMLNSPIQHCNFVDFFGPGVNLASRMESKICEIPGGIAFTVYSPDSSFENSQRIIRSAFKDQSLKDAIKHEFYQGYAIHTTTTFRELDIAARLHGALPVNKNFTNISSINIVILLPDKNNYVGPTGKEQMVHSLVTGKGRLRNEYLDLLNPGAPHFEYLRKVKENIERKTKKRKKRRSRTLK